MSANGALMEAALAYAERGWSVLPCSPRDKKPLVPADKGPDGKSIKGTGGLKKASRDAEQIRAWWMQWPSAMIGVRMGDNGLFALDYDPRTDPDTGEVWDLDRLKGDLEAQIGETLPISLAARTPSGGVHVYLHQPADGARIRNRGNLPKHIDVRGEGGYVIAPPSVMANGSRYRWLRGEAEAMIVDAPASLVAILQNRKGATNHGSLPPQGEGPTREAIERYAESGLERECKLIREAASGERQNALNDSAVSIAGLVAAGAIREERARSAILAAALANPGNDDPDQINRTIDSGWTFGLANPRDLSNVGTRAGRGGGVSRSARPKASSQGPDDASPDADALHRKLCVYAMTDLGNAERFAARFGHRIRYVDKMGWMAYDGERFILDGAAALIGGWVQETVRLIRKEADAMQESGRRDHGDVGAMDDLYDTKRDGKEVLLSDKLRAWGRASESNNRLGCIPGIAANLSTASLTIQPEQLDRNPFLLNVKNGTLEVWHDPHSRPPKAGLRLRPHDPNDLITRVMPVEYRPGAECPIYDRFLPRVQPDSDMRRFLHQWGGLSLTGDVTEQKLVFHHGKGANGKSTLVDTWATIAGDYSGTVPIETFLDQGRKRKGSDASPDLAALVGVRMLRTSEPEKGAKLAEALIKLATGGEPMPVRRLMRDPFDLYPAFKMTISGNHRPAITGGDDGIWRRVFLVPWDEQIPDTEKDRQLVDKMRAEGSGILNRLLTGLIDWRLNGLIAPASVIVATATYREESDPLGRFLATCVVEEKDDKVRSSQLYELFKAWANAAGEREWTQKGFSQAMLDRGFTKKESMGMWWIGLRMVRGVLDFEEAKSPTGNPGVQNDSPFPSDHDDVI